MKGELIPIVFSLEEHSRSLQSRMSEVNMKCWKKCLSLTKIFLTFNKNSLQLFVNIALTKRIVTLECQCWTNTQYSRKECVEVVGTPRQVDDKLLEAKVLSLFQKVGCTIAPEFIDDSHWLGKNNDRAIVKFDRRKDCKQVLQVKKDL